MITRAQLLGALMEHYERSVAVAGTHGKTTTTGMLGEILLCDDEKPTISIGGVLPAIGSNICVGDSDVFLTEACEYTNSYHVFYPKYNVILNVEEDHMDFFKDLDDIRNSFRRYAHNTAKDGALVIGGAIPHYEELTEGLECKVITFGEEGCDYTAKDVRVEEGEGEGLVTRFTVVAWGEPIGEVSLRVPGKHNVGNALAAIAVAREMGIAEPVIFEALARFGGTKRRFEYRGHVNGASIYDDYAHHPTEIAATIAAARTLPHKQLVVVFQPHTYTRTKAFLDEFAEALSAADVVGLCPVYAAREEDIYGVHSEDIAERIERRIEQKAPGCQARECQVFEDFGEAEKFLKNNFSTGDLLITMGAGNVVNITDSLLKN